jgi:hypothetical protein
MTIEVDDDVLKAMKKIAADHKTTVGRVVSDLVRESLSVNDCERVRNGVPLLPQIPEGHPLLTMEMVNELRDQE